MQNKKNARADFKRLSVTRGLQVYSFVGREDSRRRRMARKEKKKKQKKKKPTAQGKG